MKQRKKRKTKAVRKFTNGFFYFRKKTSPVCSGAGKQNEKEAIVF